MTAVGESTETATSSTGFTRKQMLLLLTGLLLAQMAASIEGTVVSTAYPTIARDLGGLKQISWIFTSFLLTSTTSTMLWGKLSDLFGRRRFYELALLVFMVGSTLCGAAQSMQWLIWARALQGIGAGGIFTLTMTIMGDVMSPRERGKYQGYMMSVFAGSLVAGPLIGGLLVDHANWRWIFYMNLPFGFAALWLSRKTLNLQFSRRSHAVDYLGVALMTVWVTAILLVLKLGEDWGWTSGRILGLTALFAITLIAFIYQQAGAPEPVMPLRLFRERIFTLAAILQFLVGIVFFAVVLYAPLFLQVVTGQRATDSGLLITPMTFGMLFGSSGSGRIFTKTGRYKKFPIIGGALLTAATALMATMNTGTGRFLPSLYMFLFGIGGGFLFMVLLVGVQNRVDHGDLGISTSAINFFRSLGNTFATALFAGLFITRLDSELARQAPGSGFTAQNLNRSPQQIQAFEPALRDGVVQAFTNSLHLVFLLLVPLCAAVALISIFIPEYPLRDRAAVGSTNAEQQGAERSRVKSGDR